MLSVGSLVQHECVCFLSVTFINKLKNQKCFEGETVIFTCEVSQENVTGKWKKDGTDLESFKSIRIITVNGRIHNLVMQSVTLNDEGYYSFKVTDKYSAAHLIIGNILCVNLEVYQLLFQTRCSFV